ncbi:TrfB-related DNA-binding protein [Xenophilus azovorans]|uniref:TrfB-related DNA-binding protein n=1 Tax=Xenophilus azovorans TaxID=151755 RepID=UPI000570B998|nr:TrfB-related DNA-binding protein [Xenophilus azovorans]
MRPRLRLTQAEFDILLPLLKRMTADRIESARLVLVDGLTYEAAARKRGPEYTRQAVGDAVRIVRRVHEDYLATQAAAEKAGTIAPPGWETVTLTAPSNLIAEFRARVAELADLAGVQPRRRRRPAATSKA